ncbi:stAR-related lipid transfer protein 6 [Macrochelys suwanniensis]
MATAALASESGARAARAAACSPSSRFRNTVSSENQLLHPTIQDNILPIKVINSFNLYLLDTGIHHSVTHSYGMGLISSRDCISVVCIKTYDGGIFTTNSVSVGYQKCLPSPSFIHGHKNPMWIFSSLSYRNPEHSKLIVFIQPERGGMLLPSVVEIALLTTLKNLITGARSGIKMLKNCISMSNIRTGGWCGLHP